MGPGSPHRIHVLADPERLKTVVSPGSSPGLAIRTAPRLSLQSGDFVAELRDGTHGVHERGFSAGVQLGVQNPCQCRQLLALEGECGFGGLENRQRRFVSRGFESLPLRYSATQARF